jgi:hypothetical protein
MKDQNLIRLTSGEEFRYINAAEIEYVEFNAQTGKRKATMLIMFRSGEYIDLKGIWAELMQKELERIAGI